MLENDILRLRNWRPEDFEPMAQMNADPQVMRYYPVPVSADDTRLFLTLVEAKIAQFGYCFWPLELKGKNGNADQFIGMVGLNYLAEDSGIPNAPMVEIGWRISQSFWGNGYAPMAAELALRYGFEQLQLDKIYSFTSLINLPSQSVMKKIGMHNTNEDFDHPNVPANSDLQRHCLYCLTKADWLVKT